MAHSRENPVDLEFNDAISSLDKFNGPPGTVEVSGDVNAAMKVLAKTSPADMLGKSGLYNIMKKQQPGVDALLKNADNLRNLNSTARNAADTAERGIPGYEEGILVNLDSKVGFLKALSNPRPEPVSLDTKETKVIKPRAKRTSGHGMEPRLDLLARSKKSVLPSAGKAEDIISDETIISSQDKKEEHIQVQINTDEQMFTEDDLQEMKEMIMEDDETSKKDVQTPSSPLESHLVLGQPKEDNQEAVVSADDPLSQDDADSTTDNSSPDEDQFSALDNWGLEGDHDLANNDSQVSIQNPELNAFLNTPLAEIPDTSSKEGTDHTPPAGIDTEPTDQEKFMAIIGNPLIALTEKLIRAQHHQTILLMEAQEQRLLGIIEDNNKQMVKIINVLYDPIHKTHKILADKGNKPTQDREDIKNHINDIKIRVKKIEDNVEVMNFGINQIKARRRN